MGLVRRRWLKRFGLIVLGLILLGLCLIGWTKLEYGPDPLLPHKRVTITLPFTAEHEPTNMIPMGETIAHPFPGGHPGIDFQWNYPAPLIAVASGRVSSITKSTDMGEPVLYLNLDMGSYQARYKELDTIADGIKVGSVVNQGDILAYPHCVNLGEGKHCQLHWEFAYRWPLIVVNGPRDRLCPLSYFDGSALQRINALWANIPSTDQFKSKFPYICSNVFHNLDQ